MNRRLLNLLTSLSLLLCFGLAGSFIAQDEASWEVEYVSARPSGGGRIWGAYCQDWRLYVGVIDGQTGTCWLDTGLSVRSAVSRWTRSLFSSA